MRSLYISFADTVERYLKIDARYFLSGGFWMTLGQGASIFFGIITTALFAHFLSATDYGVYKYLLGIAVICSSLSLTGLGQSILQTAAKKYYGFYRQTLGINLFYNLPVTIISLIGSGYYYLHGNTTLAVGCLLIAGLQPFINTFKFIQPFLSGSKRYKESTALHTLRMCFITVISTGALYITQNVIWLFTAYLAAQLLCNLFSHWYFQPDTNNIPSDIFNRYLNYAKHTSLRNVVINLANRADTIVIFTQLGAIELALYSIATVIPEQVKASFKNIAFLLLPKYAQASDTHKLQKSVPLRSFQLLVVLLFITIVYILVAPHLYELLFPKYTEAVLYSQIIALAFPTFVLLIPYSILQSQLEESALYKITLYSSVLQIGVLVTFVLSFGLIGAIIAKIIHRLTLLVITYWYLYKIG